MATYSGWNGGEMLMRLARCHSLLACCRNSSNHADALRSVQLVEIRITLAIRLLKTHHC
jgi:hypothetical protein